MSDFLVGVISPQVFKKLFGEIISRKMDAAGVSPRELRKRFADATGWLVSPETIRNWMAGDSVPSVTFLPHIAASIGVEDYRALLPDANRASAEGMKNMIQESENAKTENAKANQEIKPS